MEILRLIALLVPLNFALTANLTPRITRHPQDWLLDSRNFSSGQPFETTASLHNPPGIAKFTCEATGAQPITYRWYSFPAYAREISPLPGNSSRYWISGPTLILRNFSGAFSYILCEAVNPFGSQMSKAARLFIEWGELKTFQLRPIYFQIPIFGCFTGEEKTSPLPGGKVTVYFQSYEVSGHQYYMRHTSNGESYTNFTADKQQSYFAFPPYVIVDPTRIKKSRNQVLCIKEWNPGFIVNSTKSKSIWPPPPSSLPMRYFKADVNASYPEIVELRLLYVPPYYGFDKRSYEVGDDFELACIAAIPPSFSKFKLIWIAPDNKEITADSESLRVSVIKRVRFAAVLRIKNIQMSDSGKYLCKIAIYNSSLTTPMIEKNITVYVRPMQPIQFTTKEAEDKAVDEGQNITVSCSFKASKRPRRIVLLRNGSSIFDRKSSKNTLNYHISVLDARKHAGVYQCLVQEDKEDLYSIFKDSAIPKTFREPKKRSIFASRYASLTVARLIINSANRHDPVIIPVFGNRLVFDTRRNDSNLTPVLVSDKDTGYNGRIKRCYVSCLIKGPCPRFIPLKEKIKKGDDNTFKIGIVSFSKEPEIPNTLYMLATVVCSDSGVPERRKTLEFSIFFCNSTISCERQHTGSRPITKITKELAELAITDVGSMKYTQLQGYLQRLQNVTGTNPETFSPEDQYLAVASMESFLDAAKKDPFVFLKLMAMLTSTVGNILRVSPAVMEEGQRRVGIANQLLKDVDRITRQIPVTIASEYAWHTTNLVLGAMGLTPSKYPYVRLNVTLKSLKVKTAAVSVPEISVPENQVGTSITIRTATVAGDRVAFSLFTNDTLLQALSTKGSSQRLLSPIIAARAPLTKGVNEPVFLTFNYDPIPENVKNETKLECALWNFSKNQWDPSGCQVLRSSSQQILCKCFQTSTP